MADETGKIVVDVILDNNIQEHVGLNLQALLSPLGGDVKSILCRAVAPVSVSVATITT